MFYKQISTGAVSMSYIDTFIQVAADSRATSSVIPQAKGTGQPVHLIQYELLSENPYQYNHEELVFEVFVRHKAIPADELAARRAEIWAELFQKGHPCMRASMLTKKYGWGAHYDQAGKIAIYALESPEYQQFLQNGNTKKLLAMRNKGRGL
jgi:Family of unknown function (DUF6157)